MEKARRLAGFFIARQARLFKLGLFVDNVFTGNRIEFFHFYLVRRRTFVFCSRVKMTCSG
jgi:hypothetical protein